MVMWRLGKRDISMQEDDFTVMQLVRGVSVTWWLSAQLELFFSPHSPFYLIKAKGYNWYQPAIQCDHTHTRHQVPTDERGEHVCLLASNATAVSCGGRIEETQRILDAHVCPFGLAVRRPTWVAEDIRVRQKRDLRRLRLKLWPIKPRCPADP